MAQKRLNDADIDPAFQQVGGKTMAQCVQRDWFGDPGFARCLFEEPRNLPRGKVLATVSGEKHALGRGHVLVLTGGAFGPPRAQQAQNVRRKHDVAILAPFRLHDADDLLIAINIADLEPHDVACAQPAAIGQRQHHPCLKAGGHGQDALDFLLTENQRYLYRLFKVKNLSHEIMTPKGHAEQEFNARHRLVARADAGAALDQMLLEILHIIRRRRLW